ncbi:NifU-like protein involved in Fe-S cluster formation [Sphingomonas sp. F9_3S_D5_B_2]
MNAPLYTAEILRLAASLSDSRPLGREDGTAELRSPTCGSRVKISVEVGHDARIEALSQQVHACAFGQASAAILQEGAIGRSADEVERTVEAITAWLEGSDELPAWDGIAALAPARSRRARHAAILLPFRSLAAALVAAGRRRDQVQDIPPAP